MAEITDEVLQGLRDIFDGKADRIANNGLVVMQHPGGVYLSRSAVGALLSHARAGSKPEGDGWLPIESKPPITHVEECGEYRTDDGMLWYFKPTHWRPLSTPPQSDATTAAIGAEK